MNRLFKVLLVTATLLVAVSLSAVDYDITGRSDTALIPADKELEVDGTLNSDGPVTVALAPVFSGGASFTKGLNVSGGTATFVLAPVFSGGATFSSGLNVSGGTATFTLAPVFSGGATFSSGLNVSGGTATFTLAPVFSGGATFSDGLKVSGGTAVVTGAKAVFTAATSVLLPTALTFASSTDGHVLTADGHGRVALEALSVSVDDWADSLKTTAFVRLPDTTLTTTAGASGSVIIVGNLYDPETMWDRDAGKAAEFTGSLWRTEQKLLPDRWLWTVSDGGDSVICWDRDDMTQVMHFEKESSGSFGDNVVSDIEWLDNKLYIATNFGLAEVDFQNDAMFWYDTNGTYTWKGNGITTRNAASGYEIITTDAAIFSSDVNGVEAIRDVFGLKMPDGSGRLAQWWIEGGGSRASAFNPHTQRIYDGGQSTLIMGDLAITPRGAWAQSYFYTADQLHYDRSLFIATADQSFSGYHYAWTNSSAGSQDLAWHASSVFNEVEMIQGASAAGTNSEIVLLGSNNGYGVYLLHHQNALTSQGDATNGGKVWVTDTYNGPYEKGYSKGAWPLHAVTDVSGLGHDLSNSTSAVTFISDEPSPTGSYANFIAGSSQALTLADHADHGAGSQLSIGAWVNRHVDSELQEGLFGKYDQGAADRSWNLFISSDGDIRLRISAGSEVVSVGPDLALNKWYYIVGTYDGVNQRLYVNGILVDTDANTGAVDNSAEIIAIGASTSGDSPTEFFDGWIGGVFVSNTAMTKDEVRGVYSDGLKMLRKKDPGPGGLTNSSVDFMQANDGYVIIGDDDSLQVMIQGATTLIEQLRVKSVNGDIADAVVWVEPGADSASYAYVTDTRLVVVQRDPNVLSAANYQWVWEQPEAIEGGRVIVDSSGVKGVFTHGQDGVHSGWNAGHSSTIFLDGHYNPFDIDHAHTEIVGASWNAIIDGGSTDDAIDIDAEYAYVHGIGLKTTPGVGQSVDGIEISAAGDYARIDNIKCHQSDDKCVLNYGSYTKFTNSTWGAIDGQLMWIAAPYQSVSGCYGDHALVDASYLFQGDTNGDSFQITDNAMHTASWNLVNIISGMDNGIVDGNIVATAGIVNLGSGNTIGDNEEY